MTESIPPLSPSRKTELNARAGWRYLHFASVFAAAFFVALAGCREGAGGAPEIRLGASHQWPGGQGDLRDEMVQMLAREVEAADVGVSIRIYAGSSLYAPMEQWPALTRGRLAITALPLAYMAGRHPEFNLTLMPGLVRNHEHARRINESEFMERLVDLMEEEGVIVLAHTWLAGGFGSTGACINAPEDVQGMQIRAAGRAFELMLAEAGASISSMPSSDIYTGLQTGVLDATNTSSASFVSYRLYEQLKCVTPPGDYALWFMYEPILMSKQIFDDLGEEQRKALLAAGKKAEEYAYEAAIAADEEMVETFRREGVEVTFMTEEHFNQWREIARSSSYEEFVERTPNGRELLDLALGVE